MLSVAEVNAFFINEINKITISTLSRAPISEKTQLLTFLHKVVTTRSPAVPIEAPALFIQAYFRQRILVQAMDSLWNQYGQAIKDCFGNLDDYGLFRSSLTNNDNIVDCLVNYKNDFDAYATCIGYAPETLAETFPIKANEFLHGLRLYMTLLVEAQNELIEKCFTEDGVFIPAHFNVIMGQYQQYLITCHQQALTATRLSVSHPLHVRFSFLAATFSTESMHLLAQQKSCNMSQDNFTQQLNDLRTSFEKSLNTAYLQSTVPAQLPPVPINEERVVFSEWIESMKNIAQKIDDYPASFLELLMNKDIITPDEALEWTRIMFSRGTKASSLIELQQQLLEMVPSPTVKTSFAF